MLKLGKSVKMLKLGKKKSSNRIKIMLRCTRSNCVVFKEEEEEEYYCWKDPPVYGVYEYFLVDLKRDRDESVLQSYCEPLLDDIRGPGNFICLGSFLYSIPLIKFCEYENIPASLPYPNNGEMVERLTEMFVTTFDKARNPKKWTTSGPVPEEFHCASLSGAIYGLESGNINNAVCFQPSENCWTPSNAPPPPDLHRCGVTGNMIPDPVNDRILVHLVGGTLTQPSLYAWHPKIIAKNGEAWTYLHFFNKSLWYDGTTLINIDNKSLLFFFFNDSKDLFQVWSLEDDKFLEINWLNEVPRLELNVVQASSMCYLGNNQLCLALSFPVPYKDNDSRITFLIFNIKQLSKSDIKRKGKEPAGDACSDSIITFTYVFSKSFQASDTRYAVDITPLGDVY